jgi:hypothetical protein
MTSRIIPGANQRKTVNLPSFFDYGDYRRLYVVSDFATRNPVACRRLTRQAPTAAGEFASGACVKMYMISYPQ